MLVSAAVFQVQQSLARSRTLTMTTASSNLLLDLDGRDIELPVFSNVLRALDGGGDRQVAGVSIANEVMQPGSHSGVLRLAVLDNATPQAVFLKKITGTHEPMAQRPWPDRRRTLAYARTEARFYKEFAADAEIAERLARLGVRLPKCALSDIRLEGVLGDAAVHEAAGDEPSPEAQEAAGALLFLECVEDLTQASPLSERHARQALRAVAGLHAACWEEQPTLRRASKRLQRHGGCYALDIRSPAELTKLRPNWDAFMCAFAPLEPELFERPSVAALGERLERWMAFASEQVSPGPADRFATIVHGDFKGMNVFFPPDEAHERSPAMLIDFASTGVGLGMCDVAMLLSHSVAPDTLAGGGQERLLGVYLDALAERGIVGYDRTTATRHFHLATVDYARFVLSRFWGGASAAAFAKRAANPNVCLPNRDVAAAIRFVDRVDASLTALDGGGGTCC